MAMSWIWGGMVILSLLFGAATGRIDAVSEAALSGAQNAVELSLSMAGVLCLWSGTLNTLYLRAKKESRSGFPHMPALFAKEGESEGA